jgi:hypothetical protein
MQNHLIVKNFYSGSKNLRGEFEEQFKNPKSTQQKRFVWDFWYDEDQYHLIRTPAFYYFSRKIYQDFHSSLVQWGRENLGCHDISPPWLSYYVDGCFQNLHSDVPHGPWAFVYSLTPQQKLFRGGETLILKESTLDYWKNYKQNDHFEYSSFVDRIPSLMNQLVVFDPRFPHGVTEVKGTRDPLKSRLVMHGWFVNPRPYVVGGLSTAMVHKSLQKVFTEFNETLSQMELLDGTLSLRLSVSAAGRVLSFKILTNTLLSLSQRPEDARYLTREIRRLLLASRFVSARKPSQITIPLIFK